MLQKFFIAFGVTLLVVSIGVMASATRAEGTQPKMGKIWHACTTDETGPEFGPCVWDARHFGDGQGRSFVIRKGGKIAYISHKRAHRMLGLG